MTLWPYNITPLPFIVAALSWYSPKVLFECDHPIDRNQPNFWKFSGGSDPLFFFILTAFPQFGILMMHEFGGVAKIGTMLFGNFGLGLAMLMNGYCYQNLILIIALMADDRKIIQLWHEYCCYLKKEYARLSKVASLNGALGLCMGEQKPLSRLNQKQLRRLRSRLQNSIAKISMLIRKEAEEEEEEREEGECFICYEQKPLANFVPCGHSCCNECLDDSTDAKKSKLFLCPVCSIPVIDVESPK